MARWAAPPADEDMMRSNATKTRNENFKLLTQTKMADMSLLRKVRPKSPRAVMSFGGGVSKSTTARHGADMFGELSRRPSFISDHGDVNKHGWHEAVRAI